MTSINSKIVAPFTQEQVDAINDWQNGPGHSFTCCSFNDCERDKQPKHGQLIATIEGMICPCGAWKQNWVHNCMIEDPYNMFPEGMKKIWKRQGIIKVIEILRANIKSNGLYEGYGYKYFVVRRLTSVYDLHKHVAISKGVLYRSGDLASSVLYEHLPISDPQACLAYITKYLRIVWGVTV